MTPCEGCPIQPSCEKKHEKPTICKSRPVLLPAQNCSQGFANIGRKRIAFGQVNRVFRMMERMEHKVKLGVVEGWE
jgi:hypothetical protein